jgi:DNA-binding MarR family transcriptional regulator
MVMTPFKDLDPILHSQLRLAVISLLMSAESAEFTYIQKQTGATAGNLSIQITKLKEAGYIDVEKKFSNNYPQTLCRITPVGKKKFAEYVNALKDYLETDQPGK